MQIAGALWLLGSFILFVSAYFGFYCFWRTVDSRQVCLASNRLRRSKAYGTVARSACEIAEMAQ